MIHIFTNDSLVKTFQQGNVSSLYNVTSQYTLIDYKIKLQKMKRILITAALPYVNNTPHLGNIVGSLLSADVFARFCRKRNYETLFVSGTDEYGSATEFAALKENLSPADLCAKNFEKHLEVYQAFAIKFDCFDRTSTNPLHTALTQKIFNKLTETSGVITVRKTKQFYCDRCALPLADRFVVGKCHHCSAPETRGDQCDVCGGLVDALQLDEPVCNLCKTVPRLYESEHAFLNLAELRPLLLHYYESLPGSPLYEGSQKAVRKWSKTATDITKDWLAKVPEPRCITRDLRWGVEAPLCTKDKKKVFYVWFDAPVGYISFVENLFAEKETDADWWTSADTEIVQFMGKDNVPFHSVIFPSTLLGCGGLFRPLSVIAATHYLMYGDAKFSKSRGVGVFGEDAVALMDSGAVTCDVWRFYLMYIRPENKDSHFSWRSLQQACNEEFANNVGNLVFRVVGLTNKLFKGKLIATKTTHVDSVFPDTMDVLKTTFEECVQLMEKVELKSALKKTLRFSAALNALVERAKPWALVKDDKDACAELILFLWLNVFVLANLLHPFTPTLSEDIFGYFGGSLESDLFDSYEEMLNSTKTVLFAQNKKLRKNIIPLLRKLESVEEFERRFGTTG